MRRVLPVPIFAPEGRSASVMPRSREASASRGSTRSGYAARTQPFAIARERPSHCEPRHPLGRRGALPRFPSRRDPSPRSWQASDPGSGRRSYATRRVPLHNRVPFSMRAAMCRAWVSARSLPRVAMRMTLKNRTPHHRLRDRRDGLRQQTRLRPTHRAQRASGPPRAGRGRPHDRFRPEDAKSAHA